MTDIDKSKIKIVLAMHGSPPNDFPMQEMAFFYGIHLREEHDPAGVDEASKQRAHAIEEKMKSWPRTADNIQQVTGIETFVGFNEFCNPTIQAVLLKAIKTSPEKIFITTTMVTPGGDHQEVEIPEAINEIAQQYPAIEFTYVWPYDLRAVASFIGNHIMKRIVP